MVRINLLPKDQKKKRKKENIKPIIGALLILYLIVTISLIYNIKTKNAITKEITNIKQEMKQYEDIKKKTRLLQEKIQKIKIKIETIIYLLEKNTKAIKTIDFITKNIPKREIFLEKIEYIKPQNKYIVYIKGNSIKIESIGKYIKRLEKTKEFKSIILEETKKSKENKEELTNFKIKIEL